uniref:hypothetical protein n=1 Tax=Pedobacter schmidteae TaxID=2201271 RepID=UPI000EB16B8E|nr:hypothetical protein [Pedobacter schmidteae]
MNKKVKKRKSKSIKSSKFERQNKQLKKMLGYDYDAIAKDENLLYVKFDSHREHVLKKYWGV